ncbi:MAG: tetratricopeptide repeat protein [Pseudobdellovibrionaceae bacterium]
MILKSSVLLTLCLLAGNHAQATDLESLLTDASEPDAVQAEKQVVAKPVSSFMLALYELLPQRTSEQNIFFRQVESGKWNPSLLQFTQAFEGTEFQKSPSGLALLGLIQFRAGLPITGTETLFTVTEVKEIHPEIRNEWKQALPANHFAWDVAQVKWMPSWSLVFGAAPGIHLMTRELESAADIARLKSLSEEAPDDSFAKGEIEWQLLLAYSMNDQADQAGKLLARMMKSKNSPVSSELMQMTAARLLFQNGYFDSSIKLYEKVPKASEYWTEAQEEIAWAYIRKGEPQNAMAISQSLVKPALASQVSPESYFVHSLSQLKICNYSGVAASLENFSKTFKKRTLDLNEVAANSESAVTLQAIETLKQKKARVNDLGSIGRKLPRLVTKDEHLFRFAQAQKHLESEAKAAEILYAQFLSETGLQASFDTLKQTTSNRAHRAKSSAIQRVQELAREEVQETKEILKKMHIIEAEVLQQTAVAEKIAKNATNVEEKKGGTGAKGPDVLRFPAEKEIWFDEISHYKIDVKKSCHAKR